MRALSAPRRSVRISRVRTPPEWMASQAHGADGSGGSSLENTTRSIRPRQPKSLLVQPQLMHERRPMLCRSGFTMESRGAHRHVAATRGTDNSVTDDVRQVVGIAAPPDAKPHMRESAGAGQVERAGRAEVGRTATPWIARSRTQLAPRARTQNHSRPLRSCRLRWDRSAVPCRSAKHLAATRASPSTRTPFGARWPWPVLHLPDAAPGAGSCRCRLRCPPT